MESPTRTLAKAVTWQATGFAAMTLIGLAVTGSLTEGGAVAALGTAAGFVSYFLHERAWDRVRWGRVDQREPSQSPFSASSQ